MSGKVLALLSATWMTALVAAAVIPGFLAPPPPRPALLRREHLPDLVRNPLARALSRHLDRGTEPYRGRPVSANLTRIHEFLSCLEPGWRLHQAQAYGRDRVRSEWIVDRPRVFWRTDVGLFIERFESEDEAMYTNEWSWILHSISPSSTEARTFDGGELTWWRWRSGDFEVRLRIGPVSATIRAPTEAIAERVACHLRAFLVAGE
jgi:hypothetical protein